MSVRAFARPGGPIRWLDACHDVVCHSTTDFGSGSRNVGLGCRFLGQTRSRSDYYWGRTAGRQYLWPRLPLIPSWYAKKNRIFVDLSQRLSLFWRYEIIPGSGSSTRYARIKFRIGGSWPARASLRDGAATPVTRSLDS